ncbi:hypothetical protein [Mameliella alba]|uniref:hypothetical protein n=1 Tax=Mameliella alba TaxID=561184 RepID=UPI000B535F80|nr:hypothetical protein [Mameliella alba]MBY6118811.1 hypothetical protein [Mameliella alba]OWV43744.1 hypothetical protein CDZ95_08735 [Mameliella alba]OWV67414.1 hypothetical protein CDZ97_02965 [Mameliella alba]
MTEAAAGKDGWLTAGLVSAGVTGLAAVVLGLFLFAMLGGGPEFLLGIVVLVVTVPVPWVCLSVLSRVRAAEQDIGETAPPRWQAWATLLLASLSWAAVNWAVIGLVRMQQADHPGQDLSWIQIGSMAGFLFVPLPALIALLNFCLRGRPVRPGGYIGEAAG